jgi:histidine triad (HIT) family protein
MSYCLICQKHTSLPLPTIAEDENALLIHYQTSPENPKMYQGHLFVEPKRHVESYAELTEAESKSMGELIHKGARSLTEVINPEHLYTFTIMHQVPHLHFHIVPRFKGTPEKYWDRELHNWPDAPTLNHDEIVELSKKLKAAIA